MSPRVLEFVRHNWRNIHRFPGNGSTSQDFWRHYWSRWEKRKEERKWEIRPSASPAALSFCLSPFSLTQTGRLFSVVLNYLFFCTEKMKSLRILFVRGVNELGTNDTTTQWRLFLCCPGPGVSNNRGKYFEIFGLQMRYSRFPMQNYKLLSFLRLCSSSGRIFHRTNKNFCFALVNSILKLLHINLLMKLINITFLWPVQTGPRIMKELPECWLYNSAHEKMQLPTIYPWMLGKT